MGLRGGRSMLWLCLCGIANPVLGEDAPTPDALVARAIAETTVVCDLKDGAVRSTFLPALRDPAKTSLYLLLPNSECAISGLVWIAKTLPAELRGARVAELVFLFRNRDKVRAWDGEALAALLASAPRDRDGLDQQLRDQALPFTSRAKLPPAIQDWARGQEL